MSEPLTVVDIVDPEWLEYASKDKLASRWVQGTTAAQLVYRQLDDGRIDRTERRNGVWMLFPIKPNQSPLPILTIQTSEFIFT